MKSIPRKRRMIYCPGPERWVTIGQYVRAVKMAKANPDREFSQGLTCWWPVTGREVVRQFFQGLQDRINDARSYSQRGAGRDGAS